MTDHNFVDPTDPAYHDGKTVLYVVDADAKSFPFVFSCIIKANPSGKPVIWGYSVYKRSPGFRTVGHEVDTYIKQRSATKFFITQNDAALYMFDLITPPDSLLSSL